MAIGRTSALFLSQLFLATAVSAGSHYKMEEDFTPQVESKYPQLEVEVEGDVGDTILSTLYSEVRPSLVLKETIVKFPLKILWQTIYISIGKGELPLYKTTADGKFYEGMDSIVEGKAGPKSSGVIFVPNDSSKSVELCYLERENSHVNCTPADSPRRADLSYSRTPMDRKDSFKKELIFTGVSQKTVTFQYKEFVDNLARAAFTTELKYDISEDGMIGYKGARFQIIKAGNTGIRYKVFRYMN